MNIVKKETKGNVEYVYFSKITKIDRKALKSIGFTEFDSNVKIDDIKCEVWMRTI